VSRGRVEPILFPWKPAGHSWGGSEFRGFRNRRKNPVLNRGFISLNHYLPRHFPPAPCPRGSFSNLPWRTMKSTQGLVIKKKKNYIKGSKMWARFSKLHRRFHCFTLSITSSQRPRVLSWISGQRITKHFCFQSAIYDPEYTSHFPNLVTTDKSGWKRSNFKGTRLHLRRNPRKL
jgi:hypothetical protein